MNRHGWGDLRMVKKRCQGLNKERIQHHMLNKFYLLKDWDLDAWEYPASIILMTMTLKIGFYIMK